MKIAFMGGQKAGCIGYLTLKALGINPSIVVSCDGYLDNFIHDMGGWVDGRKLSELKSVSGDLLVSVHGREVIDAKMLKAFPKGGINLHPCLYKYKGADPVGRMLADGETKASVGAHWMSPIVDQGKLIVEDFVDATGCKTRDEVYNLLYPVYATVLTKALRKVT